MRNERLIIRRYPVTESEEEDGTSPLVTGLKAVTAVGLAAAAAWIVYSNLAIDHNMYLPKAIPADLKSFDSVKAGRLSYYVDTSGQGTPLVLIHSINAAASSFEMSPLFEQYRGKRPVYALDLPGFGFSDRSARKYSPQLYTDAVVDFIETQVGQAADVVALSLGSEFAARAALGRPDLFHSLALISPTGLGSRNGDKSSQKAGESGLSKYLYPVFAFSLWSRPFYDLLTTHASIRYFLEKSFVGAIPQELTEYDFLTAHQPGAENAPLNFISGKLFTPNVRHRVYEQVSTRTLVIYDRDGFTSFDMLPQLLANNLTWAAVRLVPTLGLPQFEQPVKLAEALDNFWDGNIV